jgi:hypothetical protein
MALINAHQEMKMPGIELFSQPQANEAIRTAFKHRRIIPT